MHAIGAAPSLFKWPRVLGNVGIARFRSVRKNTPLERGASVEVRRGLQLCTMGRGEEPRDRLFR